MEVIVRIFGGSLGMTIPTQVCKIKGIEEGDIIIIPDDFEVRKKEENKRGV